MSHAQEENEQHRRDIERLRLEQAHLDAEDKFKKECHTLLQKVRQMQCRLRDEQMQEDMRVQGVLRHAQRVLRDCNRRRQVHSPTLRHQKDWTSHEEMFGSYSFYNAASSAHRLATLGINYSDFGFSSLGATGFNSSGLPTIHRRLSYTTPFTQFDQLPATSSVYDELPNTFRNDGGSMEAEINGNTTHLSFSPDVIDRPPANLPKVKTTHSWAKTTNNELSMDMEARDFGTEVSKDSHANSGKRVNSIHYENVIPTENENGAVCVPISSRNSVTNFDAGDTDAVRATDLSTPVLRTVFPHSEGSPHTHQAHNKLDEEENLSDRTELEASFDNSEQNRSLSEVCLSKPEVRMQTRFNNNKHPPMKTFNDNAPEQDKNPSNKPALENSSKNLQKSPTPSERRLRLTQRPSPNPAAPVEATVVQLTDQSALEDQEEIVQRSRKSSTNRTESDEVSSLSMEQPLPKEATTQQPLQEKVLGIEKNTEKTCSKAEKTSKNTKEKKLYESEKLTMQDHEDYTMKNSDDEFGCSVNAGALPFTLPTANIQRTEDTCSSSSEDSVEAKIRETQGTVERKKTVEIKEASHNASKAASNESSSSSEESTHRPAKPSATAGVPLADGTAQALKTQSNMYGNKVTLSNPAEQESSDSDSLTGPTIDDDDEDFFG
ncbi:hypothetical protein FHG87_000718 [Trinorchestia longiramus]|nr:hypothetical protein FHG87_000718 [Trinorchestia longiramus]